MLRVPNRRRVQYSCGDELITKQEFKQECDINEILTQYKKTGIINHITPHQPEYMNLPDEMDYQSALNVAEQSRSAFSNLPAAVRRFFDNDPALLLAALDDPAMRPQLEELNILKGPLNPQPPGNPANRNPSVASSLATSPELPTSPAPATTGAPSQPGPAGGSQ